MRTSAIPLEPWPLTADEATGMAQLRIKKHHVAIMLLHWFNAFVWMFELITGLALVSSPYFRVAPQWFIAIVEGVFGTRANILAFHVALGVVWILVFAVYGSFGFHTYLGREVFKKEIALDRDDWRWLIVRTLRLIGKSEEPLPPQGSYNAGQKLFAFVIYAMIPVVMLTGLVMAFQLFGPAAVRWAIALHFAAVGVVVSGLMVHVYMGAVFPEEKPAFFSMVTGSVDELYAYNHHFKWWREMKLAQREWQAEHDRATAVATGAAPPAGALSSGSDSACE